MGFQKQEVTWWLWLGGDPVPWVLSRVQASGCWSTCVKSCRGLVNQLVESPLDSAEASGRDSGNRPPRTYLVYPSHRNRNVLWDEQGEYSHSERERVKAFGHVNKCRSVTKWLGRKVAVKIDFQQKLGKKWGSLLLRTQPENWMVPDSNAVFEHSWLYFTLVKSKTLRKKKCNVLQWKVLGAF